MKNQEWESHKANFQTMLRAAGDHQRFCLGRAVSVTDPTVEAAILIVINFDGDDVVMTPVARMIDDIDNFMEEFTMDPDLHIQK